MPAVACLYARYALKHSGYTAQYALRPCPAVCNDSVCQSLPINIREGPQHSDIYTLIHP